MQREPGANAPRLARGGACSWIVIGSSPRVTLTYQEAKRARPDARTITCNRGLSIEANPDFFFLSDATACQLWSGDGKAASKRGKTKTVTLRRDPAAMKMRTVDDFDVVIREGHPFEPFQLSGCWCVEFAIRFGAATEVVLCGMDGYNPSVGVNDYFAGGPPGRPENDGVAKDMTSRVVEPLLDRIVAKYPEVSFVCVGKPWYQINRPNWRVCESLP